MLVNIKLNWLGKLLKILFLAHDAGLISEKPGVHIPSSDAGSLPDNKFPNK